MATATGEVETFEQWFERAVWHGVWGYAPDIPLNRDVLPTYRLAWNAGRKFQAGKDTHEVGEWIKHKARSDPYEWEG